MPYGGNDWLTLTQEPTLEPELPICDPHHHEIMPGCPTACGGEEWHPC